MIYLVHNEHVIKIHPISEKIYYDGKLVAAEFTVGGKNHIFKVKEGGKEVKYEVKISGGLLKTLVVIRRDGNIIFSNK